ncbi:ribonuclease H-like domain-containing protein [Tanacetum coccineum]|uniref:Ribonuclease H-like domain-containing protein n=1 Tax=Tanacetum coccineum TaxID=301880 RepID=A0ABQ5G4P6_9ASTR
MPSSSTIRNLYEMEFGMDSKSSRRILATNNKYIIYDALTKNNVPCSRRGTSYYNARSSVSALQQGPHLMESGMSLQRHDDCDEKDHSRWRNCMERDLTINGLMFDPYAQIIYDYIGGLEDITKTRVQAIHPASVSLVEDCENGNSFKPAAQTTTNAEGTSTTLILGPVTADEKTQKKNDDAKTLFAAIQTRFGGNDATKKTQKTLLKQMYENFCAPSTESLDFIFNRLQKIVNQLAILGENISQEDLNLKFLRSLPFEWNTHVVVWRNKPDLDTMSFDNLYNNFKIVEQEVKGTASSSSSSQNLAFVSSTNSTNEVNTAYGVVLYT